jgi:hypothetical protein
MSTVATTHELANNNQLSRVQVGPSYSQSTGSPQKLHLQVCNMPMQLIASITKKPNRKTGSERIQSTPRKQLPNHAERPHCDSTLHTLTRKKAIHQRPSNTHGLARQPQPFVTNNAGCDWHCSTTQLPACARKSMQHTAATIPPLHNLTAATASALRSSDRSSSSLHLALLPLTCLFG